MKTFLTLLAGFSLVATSLGQPGEQTMAVVCGEPPAQTLDPVDLDVGAGQVEECDVEDQACQLSAVLECDGFYVKYLSVTEVAYQVSFVAGPTLTSGFAVGTVSWDPDGWFPGTESIFLKNWETGDFEVRPTEIRYTFTAGGRLVEAFSEISPEEAPTYVSGAGEIEVQVLVRVDLGPGGASDKWVDKVEIIIPPPG